VIDERLRRHVPAVATRRRAESEGVDLEAMKRTRPQEYMMLNAGEAVRVDAALAELVGSMLLAGFPDREVFRAPAGGRTRLLVFPPLRAAELGRLDGLLAPLVDRPEWRQRHAYYREVADVHGRTRELALPLAAADYAGGDAVVGPFGSEAAAELWARERVVPPRVHDVFAMNGAWFCDVFGGAEAG